MINKKTNAQNSS